MTLSRLYNLVVRFGRESDPRKKKDIESFSDTAILYGRHDTAVQKILVGIDIDTAELLLADKIRASQGLDLVISHHPAGRAYAALAEVMLLQADLLKSAGLSIDVSRKFLEERMLEVARKIMPSNHMRAPDAASLLDLPFMCVHTPADNHASSFIQHLFRKERPNRLQDVVDILMALPEYKEAKHKLNNGPKIILGSPRRPAGKIHVEMTGGTEGPKEIYDKLYNKGVRTLVSMHLGEEHFKKAKDANLNVVIAGHISSDTLGLNLLLDKIESRAKESFQILNCSGFRRFRRRSRIPF